MGIEIEGIPLTRYITMHKGRYSLINEKDGEKEILLTQRDKENFLEFEERVARHNRKVPDIIRFKRWDCRLKWGRYGNDRVALELVDAKSGEPILVATTNIPTESLGPNEVFIKDYSENEGILEVLVKAGIVKYAGRNAKSGYVSIPVCKVLVSTERKI